MYQTTTNMPGLKVEATSHEGPGERLLLFSVTADDQVTNDRPAVQVAVVVDRSGSMSGRKLEIAKHALARLVRSLGPDDRIGIVTYDDQVDLLCGMSVPNEPLAQSVERIHCGGSTNLYGGWVTGAKMVGPGGRVILLSDGMANAGRCTTAGELAMHAKISYERFQVTTTTIGIGSGYDEALMAGMAREGGGSHYFAETAEAILEALGQERFSIGSVALSNVSLRYAETTRQLGHLWGGETKRCVVRVRDLTGEPATLRYKLAEDGVTRTLPLDMPTEFGHSDDATFQIIVEAAVEAESQAAQVRSPQDAARARDVVRDVVLRLLAHPFGDGEAARAIRASLDRTLDRLERLERRYSEDEAGFMRKRSRQMSSNYRDPAKLYAEPEEKEILFAFSKMVTSGIEDNLVADPDLVALLPITQWLDWPALPVDRHGNMLTVIITSMRDGFLIADIERATGMRVRPSKRTASPEEIRAALLRAV
jgi:hypothetical protein